MAGSGGVISPFQVTSSLLFLLILDWGKIYNQYLRQAGGVGCRNQLQLYLSATWVGPPIPLGMSD